MDSNIFLHDSDRAALTALKAVPGFSQITKAFMKIWSEKTFKIINMSTKLRLGENQMSKYYNMLPPICEKLGIEVPELYLELDVNPNAYTFGDDQPFIVLTSGLIETLPDDLIPTVLAHECGHIACHHTLYTTMGTIILNETFRHLSGLGTLAIYPIMTAYSYWQRCSEYSADRAAIICDGSADKLVEMCMRFAGWDKDIVADANVELFLEQAEDYRSLVKDNAWNKTLELILLNNADHPLNAVRAYEAKEWAKTERYECIKDYLHNKAENSDTKMPVEVAPKKFLGKNFADVEARLLALGFNNIKSIRNTDIKDAQDGEVVTLIIDGSVNDGWYKVDSEVIMEYYADKTDDELLAEHPGEIRMMEADKAYSGRNAEEVKEELSLLGFENISVYSIPMSKLGIGEREGCVAHITINDDTFEKDSWHSTNATVVIFKYAKS